MYGLREIGFTNYTFILRVMLKEVIELSMVCGCELRWVIGFKSLISLVLGLCVLISYGIEYGMELSRFWGYLFKFVMEL